MGHHTHGHVSPDIKNFHVDRNSMNKYKESCIYSLNMKR